MTSVDQKATSEDWRARLEELASDRCDLDVLLKDEWRHKIVARDEAGAPRPNARRTLRIDGADYSALRELLGTGEVSLEALALATLHSVLDAYGHGNQTVVALLRKAESGSTGHSMLPVVIEHAEQAGLDCRTALSRIEAQLTAPAAPLCELAGRGLFDAALVVDEQDPSELPAFPLLTFVRSDGDQLEWTLCYPGELFDDEIIAGVLDVARVVLGQLVRHPGRIIAELELVSQEQRAQLAEWNATEGEFATETRLEQLFEASAERSPEREAVVFGDEVSLSYRELNERANQLAHWLASPAIGVQPRELVGLCMDKSDFGVVSTLGIWKAGAAYVPIDPGYPADRIRFIVDQTTPTAVITNAHHAPRLRELLSDGQVRIIEIETVLAGEAAGFPSGNPALQLSSDDLAYITYTSGTTGVPKGVPKEHRSVVNSITDLSERYDMLEPGQERVALYASYVFEPHLRQTLIALINSQTLVIVGEDVRLDPDALPAYLDQHGVTYLNATGSVLQHFDLRRCSALKKIMLVGEELTESGLRRLRKSFTGTIINEYAFTEAAFVTATKQFEPGQVTRTDRSIGLPLRNVTWYVLSQGLKQLPVGAIGELYIGGCGVTRGYVNRDDLTAERFFDNPYRSERELASGANDRIYQTGDLARMLPNGEVEYLGRSDFQLKLNGVRVEPGEIESRAMEFPGVRKCAVVARETAAGNGDRQLVGYYVVEDAAEVSEADLLAFLEERLIRVMVPARMVQLDTIPVNVNGKVDWRALPEVTEESVAGTTEIAHDGGLLDALRGIWHSVLGVPEDQIGQRDDFFRLGGQSISCILLIARIRQQLSVRIGVDDVFRLRTLGQLAEFLQQLQGQTPDEDQLAEAEHSDSLLANGLQQGLLYQSLKSDGNDDAYVMQSVYRYHRSIDAELMQQAWQHAHQKYPSLRLRFEAGADSLQIVEEDGKSFDWRFVDLSETADAEEQAGSIRQLQERDRTEPYRLTDGRLFRVYLIKQRADLFTLLFSCHHIIMDGWSLPVLHDEVHSAYLNFVEGLPVDPTEDSAYFAAQRYWQAHRNDHVEYWTQQIERIEERGDLTGLLNKQSRYKVALETYDRVLEHKDAKISLGAELTAELAKACASHQVTLHSVLQLVWHKVLNAIGGGQTTVVGTIVSGRNMPVDGIESSVGLFINTLPLIVDHTELAAKNVAAAVADIQDAVNVMNSKSTVELGRLGSGGMKRRLFDTLLVLENYPRLLDETEERRHDELLSFEKDYDADKVDYPIAVLAREEVGELTISLWYASELFDDSAIETLLEVTRTLFSQVAADMSQPVCDLDLISPAMIERFDEWNDTEAEFPADKTLHGVFEDMAAIWPNEIALVYRDIKLSYRELNERANQLAHYLRSRVELRADDLIALVVDKNESMFVAILAVWKAGAAYVPIDPGYPDDRIAFMLEDTAAQLVIANETHAERLRGLPDGEQRQVLELERLELADQATDNPVVEVSSTDLAYAIYTSGTTGRPKAVLVEHIGVVNLQHSLSKLFGLGREESDEAFLSFSNYVFDHFVEQMTDGLLNGQTLVVLDDTMRTDEARLCKYLNDNKVTYLSGTPSVLSLYDFSSATSLTRVDAIGEDFTEPVFDKIRRTYPGEIINGYGPTEISITSHKRPYPPDERRVNKSIGFPVRNYTSYVLGSGLKRVPVGGVGELYIGGVGVTRGYLNRPEMTKDRFLTNPFQTEDEKRRGTNTRLYKTGDLARWLPNGEVECLGRTDFQVKIRGLRVELGELESVLSSYPGITRSLVITREHNATAATPAATRYLVGFYLSDEELDEQAIKQHMKTKLAEALVPARLIRIDDIPVTASGKLDPKRLPETDFAAGEDVAYVPPSDDVEIKVCGIWSKVLDLAPNRIGLHDDFFALGGDSIRAMALAQAMTSGFSDEIGIAAVFKHTTLAAQAQYVRDNRGTGDSNTASAVAGISSEYGDRLPVSLAQERLLFIDEFEAGTSAYNVPFVLTLPSSSQGIVIEALRTIIGRHPALRTLLPADDNGLRRQQILDEQDALQRFEVDVQQVADRAELDELLFAESEYIFQLAAELPVRVRLFELAEQSYLSIVVHHSCFDGWSWDIMRGELSALANGTPETELPVAAGSYADFAVWQRQYLTGQRLAALTEYWTQALDGFDTVSLPLDLARPAQFDYHGHELRFDLGEELTGELRALARSARVSLYSVLLGAWCLMLGVYTGQDDLVIGTPMANRSRPEFNDVIGFFVNMIVVRVQLDESATLIEYLGSVGEKVLDAQVHGELPFEQLVKELGVPADPSRHPIVGINFTLENGAGAPEPAGTEVTLESYVPDSGGRTSVKFDLSMMLREQPHGLTGTLTYADSLFEATSVHSFLDSFTHVLHEFTRLAATESAGVAEIVWTAEQDVPAALDPMPQTDSEQSLHGVFEQVAARWPDEIALVCGDIRLSYRELNERANRLAHELSEAGRLRPDDLIALMIDKSEWTIISILAVWKAGAGYLPMDPSYPDDRIAFMLDDTRAQLVLANEVYGDRLRELPDSHLRQVLELERLDLDDRPTENPDTDVAGQDLAYAIYTSGTTGQPKAVLVEHRNAVSLHADLRERYFGPAGDTRQGILYLANYVFDFSVEQLLLSILSGHKLIVTAPEPTEEFYKLADREQLSYISGTPTQLQQFDLTRLAHLQNVLVAGELFQAYQFDKIRREFAGSIYNAYGTTETTVYNTVQSFGADEEYRNALGQPLSNTRLYILGDKLQSLPPGAAGELYLAGDCVSRGYLNRRELNRERFVPNPFQTDDERRARRSEVIYKTGDVVRQRADGEIQYLGRNDSQVKIRGLRIEPGEVEAALVACDDVLEAAVVVQADEDSPESKRLVGYYVADDGVTVDEEEIRAALSATLMPAMVPSVLVPLDGPLPMTINGKLDTKALPEVEFSSQRAAYAAPRNRIEARLCELWSAQLPGSSVGVDDDFFRSGGDSIGALHLASQAQRETARKVSVKQIFDFPTVRRFVDNVLAGAEESTDAEQHGEQGLLTGDCPLLPIQDWFFAKPLTKPEVWNHNFAIRTPQLDRAQLSAALEQLVDQHDAFRLRYRDGKQCYAGGDAGVTLHDLDVSALDEDGISGQLRAWQAGFDLADGPVGCAAYLHGFADGSARIWFAMHHLVVDVVSWRIITRDLEILYHGGELGPKSGSYRQWAQAIENYSPQEGETELWIDAARGVGLANSNDYLRIADDATVSHERFELTSAETRALLTESNRAYDTDINDLLLTAVGLALRSLTGVDQNHVTVEGHGREQLEGGPDVRDTVGWFTTMHPLRVEAGQDLESSILLTSENRQRIPAHGLGYGALRGRYGSTEAPLPLIGFNYLGRFDEHQGEPDQPADQAAPWQLDAHAWAGKVLVDAEPASGDANETAIDITMSCVQGKLVTSIDSQLDGAVTAKFRDELKDALEQLIAHTATVAREGRGRARTRRDSDAFDPYILVDEGETGRPLFMLPPGEGGAESYLHNIAQQLPGNPLVVFNNLHLHTPGESFEALAEYYVDQVRQLQPEGPYSFLGWSFGGVLALEMSLRLARAGERIDNLVIIDSYFNMRQASADIGLPDKDDILDPINYHYAPSQADLQCLRENLGTVVMYKAPRLNNVIRSDEQRKVFEFYLESTPYHYLDTLLPAEAIELESLTDETHHTWVLNRDLVTSISERVAALLAARQ